MKYTFEKEHVDGMTTITICDESKNNSIMFKYTDIALTDVDVLFGINIRYFAEVHMLRVLDETNHIGKNYEFHFTITREGDDSGIKSHIYKTYITTL